MTILIPMSTEKYSDYLDSGVLNYAKENVESGRWPEKGALERSRANFNQLLPQGLETPDNYLFEVIAEPGGPTVGSIWFAVEEQHGHRSAFVLDVEIKPEFRRQGHAKAAFEAVEIFVRKLGLSSIGLHVFGHNPGAQTLYSELGYEVTSINMLKKLDVNENA